MKCIWLAAMAAVACVGVAAEDAPLPPKLKARVATVARLRPGKWPVIDGRMADVAWQGLLPLETFVPFAGTETRAKAETRAWLAYDDARLYVAIRCRELRGGEIRPAGEGNDGAVADGDCVHLFIAAADDRNPYYHLVLNPKNARWDAFVNGETLLTEYDGAWESATVAGKSEWCAEIAIPWSALKRETPEPGIRIYANLCRRRTTDSEYTSWSPCRKAFEEPDSFGTWVLR